jgi:hypothetical protein
LNRLIALVLFVITACGNIIRKDPDDAGGYDAMPDVAQLREARELVNGVRMSSTTYTLDVQIGHPIQQTKITGPTYQLEPNAAVKP